MPLVAVPSYNRQCGTLFHRQRESPVAPFVQQMRSTNPPPSESFHSDANPPSPRLLALQGRGVGQERGGIYNTKRVDAISGYSSADNRRVSNRENDTLRGPVGASPPAQTSAPYSPHQVYAVHERDAAPQWSRARRGVPYAAATGRNDTQGLARRGQPFQRPCGYDERYDYPHQYPIPISATASCMNTQYIPPSPQLPSPSMTFGELATFGVGSMSYLAMISQWNAELARMARRQPKSPKPTAATPPRKLNVCTPAVMEEDVSMDENLETVVFDGEGSLIIHRERVVFRNPWSPGRVSSPVLEEIGPLDPEPSLLS